MWLETCGEKPSTLLVIQVYNKRTMKVMETVNVVIDESSDAGSKKFGEELPKEILPPEPREGWS